MSTAVRVLRAARGAVARITPPGPGVLVLGMHRSGTSAATRVLTLLGLATCPTEDMVRGPWNPSGHWESRTLMTFDDGLLRQMGCAWWAPPPAGPGYDEAAARITASPAAGRRVFAQVHHDRPWVWKDPRACLLVPYWRQALGPRTAAVVVARHPVDVAASLERRNGLSETFGLALWERYNRLLLTHVAGMPVLVVGYDDLVSDPGSFAAACTSFLSSSGFVVREPSEEAIHDVVRPELRHGVAGRDDALARAPRSVLELHETVVALAGPTRSFEPPPLGPEDEAVSEELATFGPGRVPGWQPPGAGHRPGAPLAGTE